jgi:hypothetical protein
MQFLANVNQIGVVCFDSIVDKLWGEGNAKVEVFDSSVLGVFEKGDSALDCLTEQGNHNQIWKAGVEDPGKSL